MLLWVHKNIYMKKLACTLLTVSCFISTVPCFAIDEDTHVLPIVGPRVEKANEYIGKKIDLATIKLPKKIRDFELLEAERTFTPYFVKDHIGLWTSPLRLKFRDTKWLIPASGALTALLLTDDDFSQALTNNFKPTKTQTDISKAFGQIGGYAPILGLPGGLIATGYFTKNDRLRETGVLQYKAIAHASLIFLAASRIAGRNKPNNAKKGRGEFFESGTSFPSGHSANAWAIATVASHQYPDKKWVPIVGYTLASLISTSRVLQGTHYPADAFAGALTGYLIGKYIVKHRSQFSPKYKDKKSTSKQ